MYNNDKHYSHIHPYFPMKRFYRDTWSKVFSMSKKIGPQKVAIIIKLNFNTKVILWSALLSVQNKHNLRYIAISYRICFICHTNTTSLDRMQDTIRRVFALAYVSTFLFKLLSRTRANLFNFVQIWWASLFLYFCAFFTPVISLNLLCLVTFKVPFFAVAQRVKFLCNV